MEWGGGENNSERETERVRVSEGGREEGRGRERKRIKERERSKNHGFCIFISRIQAGVCNKPRCMYICVLV